MADMTRSQLVEEAFSHFDVYNYRDPNQEVWNGKPFPKELLYAIRMSDRLSKFAPDASDHVRLAVKCQHIGRWEIPRNTYPMDRKGYLQWRNALKLILDFMVCNSSGRDVFRNGLKKSFVHF